MISGDLLLELVGMEESWSYDRSGNCGGNSYIAVYWQVQLHFPLVLGGVFPFSFRNILVVCVWILFLLFNIFHTK